MKWEAPQSGQDRVCSGFLWLPKTILGKTRWMERASWLQTYRCDFMGRGQWYDACWSDL